MLLGEKQVTIPSLRRGFLVLGAVATDAVVCAREELTGFHPWGDIFIDQEQARFRWEKQEGFWSGPNIARRAGTRGLLKVTQQNYVAAHGAAREGKPSAITRQSEIKYLSGVEVSQLLRRPTVHWLDPNV